MFKNNSKSTIKQKVVTVYDVKSLTYSAPMVHKTTGLALRSFEQACKDPKTQLYNYPEDFIMFEIGEWDDQECTISMFKAPKPIGKAIEYVGNEDTRSDSQ